LAELAGGNAAQLELFKRNSRRRSTRSPEAREKRNVDAEARATIAYDD
jgi:hypothetical protein